LVSNPSQIASLLEADIDGLLAILSTYLSQESARLHGQIVAATGLRLDPFQVGDLHWEKGQDPDFTRLKRPGVLEKVATVVGRGMYSARPISIIGGVLGAGIGALFGGVGAVPGGYIGAAIGTAIGQVAGITTGARQGLKQLHEADRAQVARLLAPFIEDAQRAAQKSLGKALTDLEHAMQQQLTDQINREKETSEQSLESLQSARKLKRAEAGKRAAEITVALQQVERIQKQAAALAAAIAEQSGGPRPQPASTAAPAANGSDGGATTTSAVPVGEPLLAATAATGTDPWSWADE
jgi:hypothetical protein